MFFLYLGFTEANIITVYILAVLIISIFTTHRIYSLLSSVASVLIFNFFFTVPRFTFLAYDKGYPVTFLIMFISAFITSSLAIKLKNNAYQSKLAAFRTKILFDTNQMLQKASEKNEIITATANQIVKLLRKNIAIYNLENDELKKPHVFKYNGEENKYYFKNEKILIEWIRKNRKKADITSVDIPDTNCIYYIISTKDQIYGIMGVETGGVPLEPFEKSVVLSILGECALALENKKTPPKKKKQLFWLKTNSSELICCGPFPMICAHR